MAKKHVVKERVAMVSPKGSRVTVSTDLAARLVAKGYKDVDGKVPAPAPAKVDGDVPMTDAEKADVAEREADADPNTPPPSGDTPQRPSRGASLASWVDFAKAVGFEHDADASRDQIRDAYEAEHPAE